MEVGTLVSGTFRRQQLTGELTGATGGIVGIGETYAVTGGRLRRGPPVARLCRPSRPDIWRGFAFENRGPQLISFSVSAPAHWLNANCPEKGKSRFVCAFRTLYTIVV